MGVLYEGWMILAALIPSIGLLFLFWVILKHLLEGDRRERAAIRRWEEEQAAARSARGPRATGETTSAPQLSERAEKDEQGRSGPA